MGLSMINFITNHVTEILLTVFGAIVIPLLQFFGRICVVLTYPFRRDALVGPWYTYRYSTEGGEEIFRMEVWQIWRGFRGGYKVRTFDKTRPKLIYVGTISEAENHSIIAHMHGKRHKESFSVRIIRPIPGIRNQTFGIKVGVNFDQKHFATLYLFSQALVDLTVAQTMLDSKLKNSIKNHFLVLDDAVTPHSISDGESPIIIEAEKMRDQLPPSR